MPLSSWDISGKTFARVRALDNLIWTAQIKLAIILIHHNNRAQMMLANVMIVYIEFDKWILHHIHSSYQLFFHEMI